MKFLISRKIQEDIKPGEDNSPRCLMSFCIRLQNRLTKWLENKTESFSRRNWILLLIIFVAISGGYSTYMLINFSAQSQNAFSVTPIRRPGYITKTVDPQADVLAVFTEQYQRIHNFRAYMDNLANDPNGKLLLDSITHHRPGFLDSVKYIDNYYQKLKNQ